MKVMSAAIIVAALPIITGCISSPVILKDQWRQAPVTATDTVFPGVKVGMTEEQVRLLIPATYIVWDDQTAILKQTPGLSQLKDAQGRPTRFLRLNHLHEIERVFEIDHFVFVDGHLIKAFGGYSSPMQ